MENFFIYFIVVYVLNAMSLLSVYILHVKILKIEEPGNLEPLLHFYFIIPLWSIFNLIYVLLILRCYFFHKDISDEVITEISEGTKLANEKNIGFFSAYGIIQKQKIEKLLKVTSIQPSGKEYQ